MFLKSNSGFKVNIIKTDNDSTEYTSQPQHFPGFRRRTPQPNIKGHELCIETKYIYYNGLELQ